MSSVDYVPDPGLLDDARQMIRAEFPSIGDVDAEDWASEAYARLLELARSGKRIDYPARMIREIARGDLRDHLRKERSAVHKATPLSPDSIHFQGLEDERPEALSRLSEASTDARLNAIVAGLSRRQRAVFKCRFALGMSTAETARECSLGRSTVKREWSRILKAAREALAGFEGDVFSRVQLKAVHAYVFRLEELGPEDADRRLVEDDPATLQLMVETRATMRRQAGEIDLQRTLAGFGLLGGGLSFAAVLAALRGKLTGAGADGSGAAGSGSAAGGGGGALVAAGGGGKVAAGCAAALCVGGGVVAIRAAGEREQEPSRDRTAIERRAGAAARAPASLSSPIAPQSEATSDDSQDEGDGGEGGKPGHPGESPGAGPGSDTDAAVAGEEFDPLAAPAPAPPPAPAPAPSPDSSSGPSSPGSDPAGSSTGGAVGGAEFGP